MYSYIFPRTIHINELTLRDQLKKIASEVAEVGAAYASPYIGEVGVELYDVIHSIETGMRMMEEHFGLNARTLERPRAANPESALYYQIRRLSLLADLLGQAFDGNSARAVGMALLEVIVVAESALVILAKIYHVDIDACRRNVFLKNDARGYYGDVPRDAGEWLQGFFTRHNPTQAAHSTSPVLPQEEREPSNNYEGDTPC